VWSLDRPFAIALLGLLPILVWLTHFRARRGGQIAFSFGVWSGRSFAPKLTWSALALAFARFLFWVGLACLIVALAGPVWIDRKKSYLNRGMDIMIVLDESPSMLAQDFQPEHRFEAARTVIREFVRGRENDSIGLVTFGEQAVLRVPPTVDYQAVLRSLEELTIEGLSDGTAIGLGLSLAVLHLSASPAPGRVIILLTDGENNAGEIGPEQAALAAQELGTRIYTVGIGREGEAVMEVTDPSSGRTIRGVYRGRFDEGLLRAIAERSGGRYFHASSPGVLKAIFDEIDSLERTERRARIVVERAPGHEIFVLFGLLFVATDLVVRKLLLREIV
jgi:Ca-activated chloride channel family protein